MKRHLSQYEKAPVAKALTVNVIHPRREAGN